MTTSLSRDIKLWLYIPINTCNEWEYWTMATMVLVSIWYHLRYPIIMFWQNIRDTCPITTRISHENNRLCRLVCVIYIFHFPMEWSRPNFFATSGHQFHGKRWHERWTSCSVLWTPLVSPSPKAAELHWPDRCYLQNFRCKWSNPISFLSTSLVIMI